MSLIITGYLPNITFTVFCLPLVSSQELYTVDDCHYTTAGLMMFFLDLFGLSGSLLKRRPSVILVLTCPLGTVQETALEWDLPCWRQRWPSLRFSANSGLCLLQRQRWGPWCMQYSHLRCSLDYNTLMYSLILICLGSDPVNLYYQILVWSRLLQLILCTTVHYHSLSLIKGGRNWRMWRNTETNLLQ